MDNNADEWLKNEGYGPLITFEEAANVLCINKKTIYALRSSGRLPFNVKKIGGGLRLCRRDVAEWIEDGSIKTNPRRRGRGRPKKSEQLEEGKG